MEANHVYRWSRVQEPRGYEFRAACLGCREPIGTGVKWADLNGEPYRAYYCDHCKQAREEAHKAWSRSRASKPGPPVPPKCT